MKFTLSLSQFSTDTATVSLFNDRIKDKGQRMADTKEDKKMN